MRECADEVLTAARAWWPHAGDHRRAQLAAPLKKLADVLADHDQRKEPLARPGHKMGQQAYMWACYRAAEEIRLNVRPDEKSMELWSAGARLAFISTSIKAYLLGDSPQRR